MPTEIERKFLVKNDHWKATADQGTAYRQGYLTRVTGDNAGKSSVRVRIEGDCAKLNIKSATLGIFRQEYEYEIPVAEAEEMLDTLTIDSIVEKTRYHVPVGRHTWEVDVFAGDNAGLVVAEVELAAEDEVFEKPDWAGDEVSEEAKYFNVCLAQHPYKDW